MTTTVGLHNPSGTISHFAADATGNVADTQLIAPVSVPSGDEHHLTDYHVTVGGTAATGTRFRVWHRTSSTGPWIQDDEVAVEQYGDNTVTLGTSIKMLSGWDWRVTYIQDTIARVSIRVGGQAQKADSRNS